MSIKILRQFSTPNKSIATAESSQPDPRIDIKVLATNSDLEFEDHDRNIGDVQSNKTNDRGEGEDTDGNKSAITDRAVAYRVVKPEAPRRVMSDSAIKKKESKLKNS